MKITVKQLRKLISEERALAEVEVNLDEDITDDIVDMAEELIRFAISDGLGMRDSTTARAALETAAEMIRTELLHIERERQGL